MPEDGKFVVDELPTTAGWLGSYSQLLNPAEPATLKVLLKGKKQGRTYAGKITEAALAKVSPWFRASSPFNAKSKRVVSYELTLGPDGLPRKLVSSLRVSDLMAETVEAGEGRLSTETTYSGWGSKVTVSPPPKSAIA